MTTSANTPIKQYAGNDVTVIFPIVDKDDTVYVFLDNAHIVVKELDTATDIETIITTGITITGAGEADGGEVTYDTAPATGTQVTIEHDPTKNQGAKYREDQGFPSETHEQQMDKAFNILNAICVKLDRIPILKASDDLDIDNEIDGIAAAGNLIGLNSAKTKWVFLDPADIGSYVFPAGTGILVQTGVDTATVRTLVAGDGISLINADGVAGNITITNSKPSPIFGQARNVVVLPDTGGTLNEDFLVKSGAQLIGAVKGTVATLSGDLSLDAAATASYDDATLAIVDTSYAFVVFLDSKGVNSPTARFVKEGNVSNANITYPGSPGDYDDFKRVCWGHCDNATDNPSGGAAKITWFAFRNNRLEFDSANAVFNMATHTGTTADTAINFNQYRPSTVSRFLIDYSISGDMTVDTQVGNAESGSNGRSSFIYDANQAGGAGARIQKEVQLSAAGTYILRNGSNTQSVQHRRVGWYDDLTVEE